MSLKMRFNLIKDTIISKKKYIFVYLAFITLLFFTMLNYENFLHPKMEVIAFVLVAILGVFCIVFYFLYDSDKELYKTAFVIILCFGLICSFVVPICDVSDETEHLYRAEITSTGVLVPHWTGEDLGLTRTWNQSTNGEYSTEHNDGAGYESIKSMNFFSDRGKTIFTTSHDEDKINYSPMLIESAFEQNPFYGYLPQAVGMGLAKLLDLNVIWMMWLGRICNLLCYALLVAYAVKKTPILKVPLMLVACIPITIYQVSSMSIDSIIIALGLVSIAYFIFMCKSKEKSLGKREICIFSIICLLLGLCKLPYLAFIFLLLFVPKENFIKDKKSTILFMLLNILVVAVIGLIWSRYASPALLHGWRSRVPFNQTLQIMYIFNHPLFVVSFLKQIFSVDLFNMFTSFFKFYNVNTGGYDDYNCLISLILSFFVLGTLLFYPNEDKFEKKTKIGAFLVMLVIYVGTCIIQLLTWASVGKMNLGISIRYFIPLLALIPILGLSDLFKFKFYDGKKLDNCIIILIISFLSLLILSFIAIFY